jgi:hypothetical protein
MAAERCEDWWHRGEPKQEVIMIISHHLRVTEARKYMKYEIKGALHFYFTNEPLAAINLNCK